MDTEVLPPEVTVEEFQKLGTELVPIVDLLGLRAELVERGRALVRIVCREEFVRPGGSIAGPCLLAAADFSAWGAVLSVVGRSDLSMTTNLNFNFLRPPAMSDVIAEATLLKVGRRLAVVEVSLYSRYAEPEQTLVGHATCTYSIAPTPGAAD